MNAHAIASPHHLRRRIASVVLLLAVTGASTAHANDVLRQPGAEVTFAITVHSQSAALLFVENTLLAEPPLHVASTLAGAPACWTTGDTADIGAAFGFVPATCTTAMVCRGVRARVFARQASIPLADGSSAYRCRFRIPCETQPGVYKVRCAEPLSGDEHSSLPTDCRNGEVRVVGSIGDCDRDGIVTIDDLLTGINIAIGLIPLASCPTTDANGDGEVDIAELVNAVAGALFGCAAR